MNVEIFNGALYWMGLLGNIAFVLSGIWVGVRKDFDLIGIFIIAFLTANGGGIIRDLLIGRAPLILQNAESFWITASVCTFVLLLKNILRLKNKNIVQFENSFYFILCDAIGLISFSIAGALLGIERNIHFFGVITLSFLTATGGGILRDIIVKDVPEIFHSGFYGTVAIIVAIAIYGLNYMHYLDSFTLIIVFLAALALRLFAYLKHWQVPKF